MENREQNARNIYANLYNILKYYYLLVRAFSLNMGGNDTWDEDIFRKSARLEIPSRAAAWVLLPSVFCKAFEMSDFSSS